MARRLIALLCVTGSWLMPTALEAVSDAAPADTSEARRPILQRMEQLVRSYDLNKSKKYHIDIGYSPIHAMAAYRELLLWSGQPKVPEALRQELLGTITAGMLAVIRDSGAGPEADTAGLGIGFVRAMPHYSQEPDPPRPETLRWRQEDIDPHATPAGVGSSLSAKSLLLTRLKPDSPEHGVVLASLKREYEVLAAQWLNSAPGGYMPETARWEKGAWQPVDGSSRLWSQAVLLSGLVETEAVLARLGGNTKEWRARLRRGIADQLTGMVNRHYDSELHTFVDVYEPGKGRGDRISLDAMAQLIDALTLVLLHQPPESPASKQARQLGAEQIRFLMRVGRWQESVPHSYLAGKGTPLRAMVESLRDLLAVATILQESSHYGITDGGDALSRVKESLETAYWAPDPGIYRTAAGFTASAYDGHLFGLTLGYFRREGGPEALSRAEGLIDTVFKKAGLLWCEPPESGESMSLEQAMAQRGNALAADMESLTEAERAKRTVEFALEIADQDGDGVPGCRFAGRHFGGAPVPVNQTSIQTPYPPVEKVETVEKEEKSTTEGQK